MLLGAWPALAHPFTLTVTSGTAAFASTPTQSGGKWTVLVDTTGSTATRLVLSTTDPNTEIALLEIDCGPATTLVVNQTGGGTFSEIGTLQKDTFGGSGSLELELVRIAGSVTGYVVADTASEFDIGGDYSAITSLGTLGGPAWRFERLACAGELSSTSFRMYSGAIDSLEAVGGIVTPTDIGVRGGITSIEASSIGTSCWITANYATGTGTMTRVVVDGDMQGELVAYTLAADGSIADPGIRIAGDMAGFLGFYQAVRFPIEIEGDLLGSMLVLEGGLDFGSATAGDITILGSMGNDSSISFAGSSGYIRTLVRIGEELGGPSDSAIITAEGLADGEVGQVIFGANGTAGSQWNGDVSIDGSLLAGPYYSDTGLIGAVGEVPFHLHAADCFPPDGESTGPGAYFIKLRFYGPVTWDLEEGMPFLIEYTEDGTNWTSDNANWFVEAGRGTRELTLFYFDNTDPSIIPGPREYRITPLLTGDGALLCDRLLTEDDVPVGDFEYHFFTP